MLSNSCEMCLKLGKDAGNRRQETSSRCLKIVKKLFPILTWGPKYKKGDILSDLIAGLTVGLTLVPQSMAYAGIAGLSPEYGLYSSYIGAILYVFLGSCRQVSIGPTAVMGLLTYESCGQDNASCAILAGFYSGIFELGMSLLQLGWVVSYISQPVTIGFTAGAATTIFTSQIKNFLGIGGKKGSKFIGYWKQIILDFKSISLGDSILGISSLILLLLLRRVKELRIQNPNLKKIIWFISVGRNALIIVASSALAFFWRSNPFRLTGFVQGGFPSVSPPPFQLPKTPNQNSTDFSEENMTFTQSLAFLGTGPIILALISVLQNVAISKAFGVGQAVDANNEMLALAASNIVGGFFSAIPTSGSFSRSAVNDASGVKSPLGGLFTGVLVILSLWLLTPTFYYIPKASLSAVIIGAVIFMIEWDKLLPMWRISKIDLAVCIITYLVCLIIGMEVGILVGVGLSLASLLFRLLRPPIKIEVLTTKVSKKYSASYQYLLITPPKSNGIHFPSADHLRDFLTKQMKRQPQEIKTFVLDLSNWDSFDYTSATTISALALDFERNDKNLIFLKGNDTPDLKNSWTRALEIGGIEEPKILGSFDEVEEVIWSNLEYCSLNLNNLGGKSGHNYVIIGDLTHPQNNNDSPECLNDDLCEKLNKS